jgi:hypothetical protein
VNQLTTIPGFKGTPDDLALALAGMSHAALADVVGVMARNLEHQSDLARERNERQLWSELKHAAACFYQASVRIRRAEKVAREGKGKENVNHDG